MKIIAVTHHLPTCLTLRKDEEEALIQELSRPLLDANPPTKAGCVKSLRKASEADDRDDNRLICFQKSTLSTFFTQGTFANGVPIRFLGIPGLYNKELSENLTRRDIEKIKEKLTSMGYYPIVPDFNAFKGEYDAYSGTRMLNVCFYKAWNDTFLHFDEEKAFKDYKKLNEIYCNEIIKVYEKGDIIWVLDHDLWLLPGMLKNALDEAWIGVTALIPFPSSEVFRCLSHSKDILRSLLSASYIEFQSKTYLNKFIYSCSSILSVSSKSVYDNSGMICAEIYQEGHHLRMGVSKIGTNYKRIDSILNSKDCQEEINFLKKKYEGKKIIVTVSNLILSHTITNVLIAFEAYLYKYGNNVILLDIETPGGYPDLEVKSENSRLIEYITLNYPNTIIETISALSDYKYYALLAVADLGLILSERSAINKPSLDFIVAQQEKQSPLIVSEFARFNEGMPFIKVNPKDALQIAEKINEALTMAKPDAIVNHVRAFSIIKSNTTKEWINRFIYNLTKEKRITPVARIVDDANEDIEQIKRKYFESKKRLFLFDYDGTLTEIKPIPSDAIPDSEIMNILDGLADDENNEVYIITGRDRKTISEWLPNKKIGIAAEHGIYTRIDGNWDAAPFLEQDWKNSARCILKYFVERSPGSFIEEKESSICFHYRRCAEFVQQTQAKSCKNLLERLLVYKKNLEIIDGKCVIEIRVCSRNKGDIVRKLLKSDHDFILCSGDDKTDESMFAAGLNNENFYSIAIGTRANGAKFRMNSVEKLRALLKEFVSK
ncbi:Alpha,alpha-trehalose-phosphate synthase [UDP-forming] B [Astathelohania contejeani]|uniref:Alpha,alpha-trehalose-phosphate synthase [UDP-forming] B n=1 Tax=Astathelohania contejeani TaxID=164912 RepID=A0ABQ7HX23_9MICR|nr:Alpha,alpha-trehalose-phosphate synthase [UDP-forming] B [Thelohania contejeani]